MLEVAGSLQRVLNGGEEQINGHWQQNAQFPIPVIYITLEHPGGQLPGLGGQSRCLDEVTSEP